ncbi:class I SAM-dependent methyltransferase [Sphingopyxis macrogoltabida]|uniref:Methyltransferase n=1 Tax=Sphingopyxis macrogoltabida TaxID=33050 RepID=A0AAC8Z1A9_SPHMC|nr:class I SAM-dependent methyltransferase [Sphingopyxis macrogoltabida]ALJ12781.1 methyltransferase [Sphingopyxis macrogoltabida]AMU89752.1 methyltransferase [Sphingopyxis macrogoltabida]
MSDAHGKLMDGIYRYQRHFYDFTRKYFLLGRDEMIAGLAPPPGGAVLEIGCGTGRNLVLAGRAWPEAQLFGVDISAAMLDTARAAMAKAGLDGRAVLAEGDARDFDPAALFGRETFDRIFISYALSMIPDWATALAHAARYLAPGGRIEIVDFGQQDRLPTLWKRAFFGWLAHFHVVPRADLARVIAGLARETGMAGHCRSMARGYAIRGGLARG